MRWHSLIFKLSLLAILVLLFAHPVAARGNTTSGIYPGTVKDICAYDTIFVGETGLNLTPLTPYASGVVQELRKYANDQPDPSAPSFGGQIASIPAGPDPISFSVPPVSYYGVWYPVVNGKVIQSNYIQIQPYTPNYPANVIITSGSDWMVANGADSAPITISAMDIGNNPVSGANLVLRVDSPWKLQDSILKTDGSGKAQTRFLPTTKSGNAVIAVTASPPTPGPSVTATGVQKIDADTPAYVWPLYSSTATVASPVTVSAFVLDRYGNAVTSRRVMKNVTFLTGNTGTGYFTDGTEDHLKGITVPLNDTGFAGVTYFLSTDQGNNFISILPPAPVAPALVNIVGIGNSVPFSISQMVNPAGNPPYIPADGQTSVATIDYYLLDEWGNPAGGQGVQIITSAGENRIFYTNQEGRVTVLYGPKKTAGFYSLTATATANSSVRISQTLQFGSLKPQDMLLTASPQTMASLDVNPAMVGHVVAKVIDDKGNPVMGETVTFTMENATSAPYNLTTLPSIGSGGFVTMVEKAPVEVTTDENGQAILDYYPGAFPKPGNFGWSETAQGMTMVNATWDGPDSSVTRSIDLSYKNYPFLSVYTEVNPKTVEKGNFVDVSVRLKGDGWALQPKPIDVVLCTDRSGTMLINQSVDPFPDGVLVQESLNDRMVDAMNASRTFVGQTTGQDRIGLVTFGDPAGGLALLNKTGDAALDKYLSPYWWRVGRDYNRKVGQKTLDPTNRDTSNKMATIKVLYPGHGDKGRDYRVGGVLTGAYVESTLTYDKAQIINAINSTVPAGGTPMRRAIYESVKLVNNNPRDGAVKAIVLLTDGNWNTGGDPEGIDSSVFGIESYPEVQAAMGGDGTGSVIRWANLSHIKIFTVALKGINATDGPDTGALGRYARDTGGIAYQASSGKDLTRIYMDIAGALREEASVDTIVNLDFGSVEVTNVTPAPSGKDVFAYQYIEPDHRSTWIMPPSKKGVLVNNETSWNTDQGFTFSAGTIKVNEEWVVNFTLKVLTEGNIKILSSKTSEVTFNGTAGSVGIPDTFITSVPQGIEKGPEGIVFEIKKITRLNPETDHQVATMSWTFDYTGFDKNVTWEVWLAPPFSGTPQYKDTFTTSSRVSPIEAPYNLPINGLAAGTYAFTVKGHVNDANDRELSVPLIIPEQLKDPKIKIT
jgi:hypothetical protein